MAKVQSKWKRRPASSLFSCVSQFLRPSRASRPDVLHRRRYISPVALLLPDSRRTQTRHPSCSSKVQMSRRKEANRAEAIVRAIGAIIMLLFLWGMVAGVGHGKNQGDPIAGLLSTLTFFVLLFGAITVVGLIVWFIVLKRPRRHTSTLSTRTAPTPTRAQQSSVTCADCGTSITPRIVNYCQGHAHMFHSKLLCMPCQNGYRR
jgi:hypothetical protein